MQVYLELMAGDKRDRETAEQVKSLLLEKLEREPGFPGSPAGDIDTGIVS